jgi:hypothetical protein
MVLGLGVLMIFQVAPVAAQEVKLLSDATSENARLINLDQMQGIGHQAAGIKKVECLRAFGQNEVCACLASALPVQVSLVDYLRVAGMSSGVLHERRKGLSPEEQQVIDQILAARARCVSTTSPLP